jgi:hypothetical protein
MAEMPKAQGTKNQLHGRDPSGGVRYTPPEDQTTLASQGIDKLSGLLN